MSKEKRLVVRFRFPAPSDGRLNRFERLTEDGMVEVEEPAEKVQGTVLQQLAADAKTSGDRSLYEAELRRIVDNSFAVERDHAVRAHVDDLLRERAAVRLPWRDELSPRFTRRPPQRPGRGGSGGADYSRRRAKNFRSVTRGARILPNTLPGSGWKHSTSRN